MHWLDIILIAIVVVFVIIGIKKGLISSVLSLANWLVSILAAFFLAQPVSNVFNSVFKLDTALGSVFKGELLKLGGSIGEMAPENGWNAIEFINQKNNFWLTLLSKLVDNSLIVPEGKIPAVVLGDILGGFASIVISGIVLFILIRLLIVFINGIVSKLKKSSKVFKNIDGSLGGLFGFIKSLLIIITIFISLSFLKVFPFVNSFVENEVQKKTFIAKYCEKGTNWVVEWTTENINIQDIINNVVNSNNNNAD